MTTASTIQASMLAKFPDLDINPGRALYDLLALPSAYASELLDKDLATATSNCSLSDAQADPDNFDSAQLDKLASNLLVSSRKSGAAAKGELTLILSAASEFVIPIGSTFTTGGLTYETSTIQVVSLHPSSAEIPLTARGSQFAAKIQVVCQTVGSAGNLAVGTSLDWASPSSNFVRAIAEAGIYGGTDVESNSQLLTRMAYSLAARCPVSRLSVLGLLDAQSIPYQDIAVIGAGDALMLRDRNNVLKISTGGCIDLYLKHTLIETLTTGVKGAIADVNSRTVSILLPPTLMGGAYSASVFVEGHTTELEILDLQRRLFADRPLLTEPDVHFTAFQFLRLTVIDTLNDFTGRQVGDTLDYVVRLAGCPQLSTLQALVDRTKAANILARAAYPVYCTVDLELDRETSADNLAAARTAVTSLINGSVVGADLIPTSAITAVVNKLTGAQVVGVPTFLMRGLAPEVHLYRSSIGITVPPAMASLASVSAFYSQASDISISIKAN